MLTAWNWPNTMFTDVSVSFEIQERCQKCMPNLNHQTAVSQESPSLPPPDGGIRNHYPW